jgi:hypothetical protein
MVDPDTTLGEELAAEIQVGVEELLEDIETNRSTLDSLLSDFRDTDIRRGIPKLDDRTTITAVTTHSRRRPAFSNLLNGAAALSVRVELGETTIHSLDSNARTSIDLIDFIDAYKHGRWIERNLAFDIVADELENETDLFLVDVPLTITRQEFLTRTDSPVWDVWEDTKQRQSTFWEQQHQHLGPWNDSRPAVVGWTRPRGSLLFSALEECSPESFPEPLSSESASLAASNIEEIEQVGPHRLLSDLLQPSTRTVAYPYRNTSLDARWEPEKLHDLGMQGVFCQLGKTDNLAHLELPGGVHEWTESQITEVLQRLDRASWLQNSEVPVPLWYARKECEFPEGVLDSYHAKLKQQSHNDDT